MLHSEATSRQRQDDYLFPVNVPETELTELRRRIKATRWPERETVTDATQGVQLATMQALARIGRPNTTGASPRQSSSPCRNFLTEIDGLDIHFIHIRSKHENALPLIVTHGWPGSITEQLKIIDPLTDPTAHGGNASDAFHIVVPSMPGYGFSGKPTTTGWGPERIASAWAVLIKATRLLKICGTGRGLGRGHHRSDGRAGAGRTSRYSHQHARRGSCGYLSSGFVRRADAARFLRRRKAFFNFVDYLKPALRLTALARIHHIYVFTHDFVFLGEDGPTHETIEQLAMLRHPKPQHDSSGRCDRG